MPRKSTRGRSRKQVTNPYSRENPQFRKHVEGLIRASKKDRDNILRKTMKRTAQVGLYNPKSLKLTKYRRYRANKLLKEFGEVLDPGKYFFIKAPKNTKREILDRAESLKIKHSKKGVFLFKNGYTRAKIKTDKKRGELFIERSGRTKRGPTKGVRYRTVTPLASIDELTSEKERLRDMAAALGPLGKNDRLSFIVIEDGLEGYGHGTFSNIELLLHHLETYQKMTPSKVQFYRHIEIVKTTAGQWFTEHPATSPGNAGRKKRDEIRQKIKAKDTKTWNKRQKRFAF